MMYNSQEAEVEKKQALIDLNAELIEAIHENQATGRLEDCIAMQELLQKNLLQLWKFVGVRSVETQDPTRAPKVSNQGSPIPHPSSALAGASTVSFTTEAFPISTPPVGAWTVSDTATPAIPSASGTTSITTVTSPPVNAPATAVTSGASTIQSGFMDHII